MKYLLKRRSNYIVVLGILLLLILNHKVLKPTVDLKKNPPKGMVWIQGGTYLRGATSGNSLARQDEKPVHRVRIDSFWMDSTEVTNAQFKKFVEETGYITTAERKVDWEELKKQLPEGTEKPHDSILQPGSLTFECNYREISNLNDYSQWWKWKTGANWRQPQGRGSSLKGKLFPNNSYRMISSK